MRRLRFRLTIGRTMIAIALVGAFLAWAIAQDKAGRPLVQFKYDVFVRDEPLLNPVKVIKLEHVRLPSETSKNSLTTGERIELEGGRIIEIPFCDGFCDDGYKELDVQIDPDGMVTIHTRRPLWYCGNSIEERPWLRIPIFRVYRYINHRKILGRGRLIETSYGSSSRSK
jgi:hypothetical protein